MSFCRVELYLQRKPTKFLCKGFPSFERYAQLLGDSVIFTAFFLTPLICLKSSRQTTFKSLTLVQPKILTKEKIRELKTERNGAIGKLIREHNSSTPFLLNILENLGHLPDNFDGSWLPELLDNKSSQVRFWTVKNLGKLTSDEYLNILKKVALADTDTHVRREAVSSIGRMRNPKTKKTLIEILQDTDPKIVSQAIRGLLIFKGDKDVDENLKPLINHENEMVRMVIYKEFFATQKALCHQPHTESYNYLKNVVVNGDTIETMRLLKEESIHLTFTSPPYYNARDYSIYPSYKHYLNFLAEVFKQVHRITKEGRFLILNTSPIIIPRIKQTTFKQTLPYSI